MIFITLVRTDKKNENDEYLGYHKIIIENTHTLYETIDGVKLPAGLVYYCTTYSNKNSLPKVSYIHPEDLMNDVRNGYLVREQ